MLFNSYAFILGFLPITYVGSLLLSRLLGKRPVLLWVTVCSLFFYGWWNPVYLLLLLPLVAANFLIAGLILKREQDYWRKALFIFGLALNIGVLCYFKYANFFVESANSLLGKSWHVREILLPLGISFFTFQKIAYLVDAYTGKLNDHRQDALKYTFFVSFFPQLIAGPIVHYQQINNELGRNRALSFRIEDFTYGLFFFFCGLFKKIVIADNVAVFSSPLFVAVAEKGHIPNFLEAWFGALAYSLQIYFDFSGYSEMALGLGLLFGIRLPANFYSPYKASSIIDFWRRWHITLSRFLRDYIYIPLGGNRKGNVARYANLMITMLIGGFWHGAGFNFIIWGLLHGSYLIINHLWRHLTAGHRGRQSARMLFFLRPLSVAITYACVVFAWVFFRATTLPSALVITKSMLGLNGISLPTALTGKLDFLFGTERIRYDGVTTFGLANLLPWLIIPHLIVWFAPNLLQIMGFKSENVGDQYRELPSFARWQPNIFWSLAFCGLFIYTMLNLSNVTEFLYFQF